MPEDIVSRIVELDRRAQEIVENAHAQVERVRAEAVVQARELQKDIQARMGLEVDEVVAKAAAERQAQVAKVRESFRAEAQAVRKTAPEAVNRAVKSVISYLAGRG